jgi:drug/metabolite transporter (DMT)-like permease
LNDSVGKAYKPWIIVSLVMLVGSIVLLGITMTVAFLYHQGTDTPVWVIVIAVLAGLGVLAGFGGFALLMFVAGWNTWRESRRVQVLPPEHVQ